MKLHGSSLTLQVIIAVALLASLSVMPAEAQKLTLSDRLRTELSGQGRVRIECDARLDSLIGYVSESEQTLKATGFRIQIYAGNNTRDARSKALQAEDYIKENYPELPVYTVFKSPRWLCTVGDFLSFEAAYDVMHRLRKESPYKGLIILRNQEIKLDL